MSICITISVWLSLSVSVCINVRLNGYLHVPVFVLLLYDDSMYVHLSVYLYAFLYLYNYVCMYVYLSVCLSCLLVGMYISLYLSICMPFCMYVHLSVCLRVGLAPFVCLYANSSIRLHILQRRWGSIEEGGQRLMVEWHAKISMHRLFNLLSSISSFSRLLLSS